MKDWIKLIGKKWYVVLAIIMCIIVTAHLVTLSGTGNVRCSGLDYILVGDANDACKIYDTFRKY